MSIPTVPTYTGTPPSSADPANFDARADPAVNYIATLAPSLNAFASAANAQATDVTEARDETLAASAAAVGAANYRGDYSAGTTYTLGQSVSYDGVVFAAKKTNLGITPVDGADWRLIPASLGGGGRALSLPATLTANSEAAIALTATAPGQALTLPDATTMPSLGVPVFSLRNASTHPVPLRDATGETLGLIRPGSACIVMLTDKSTPAGAWGVAGLADLGVDAEGSVTFATPLVTSLTDPVHALAVRLDAQRTLLLFGGASLHAVVYDLSTNTFGAAVLVRAAAVQVSYAARGIDSGRALVWSLNGSGGTQLQAVVLSVAGTTITVGTAAAVTMASASFPVILAHSAAAQEDADHAITELQAGTYVFAYQRNSPSLAAYLRVLSVSGAVVTIGAESVALGGASQPSLYRVTDGVVLAISHDNSGTVHARPFTVSGTSLSPGTAASAAGFGSAFFVTRRIGTVWCAIYGTFAAMVSVTGTVALISSVVTLSTLSAATLGVAHLVGSKIIVGLYSTGPGESRLRVISESGGAPVLGAEIALINAYRLYGLGAAGGTLQVLVRDSTGSEVALYSVGVSGNDPQITRRSTVTIQPDVIDTGGQAGGGSLNGKQSLAGIQILTGPRSGITRFGVGLYALGVANVGGALTVLDQVPAWTGGIQNIARESDSTLWFPRSLASTTKFQLTRVRAT